ncbi:MmgE/PrpD family protein [Salmonella enterica]|nr:MmgE/PrpD family protein [Salmonella enterica]EJA5857607.1 MmgE/PrpD family protein [Salmonella enterica]EJF5731660.1 MmgE/PrpD family protein [Salmonella enterica]EJU3354617.1 MmgE/PrpD family protein [Salmonella enterica]EJX4304735.1 MmgE/PrpD family protein [Salmonella enterica]
MKRTQVDPVEELINFASQADARMIPSTVLAFQCKRLIDNLGCLAAGYDQNGTESAVLLARRWSGNAEATIIGSKERLAAPQVAFVNAVRSRALDYCDVISPGWHPSSSDIPVALATAELTGASGLEMLAALAIGQDFAQRINLAAQANGFFYRGFDANILGLFSGAVIASRLLHLNPNDFANAIGLAFDFGIGTFQHYQDKTLAVRISQGLVARHALEAAMMAQAGISGPKRVLNGENGFFNLYAPDEPDLKQLTHQLGIAFLGEEATCFKLYPHCSILLALTDTLLNPETRHQLSTDPAKIILYASPAMYMVCGAQYQPQKTAEIDAQFSARYIIANALLRGQASAREFSAAFATEPTVVELAQRIEVYEQASLERFDHFKLHITSEQGDTLRLESKFGRGWPENPADMQDIREKFLHCCFQSPCRAMKLNAQQLLSCIGSLVEAPSLHELLAITREPQ